MMRQLGKLRLLSSANLARRLFSEVWRVCLLATALIIPAARIMALGQEVPPPPFAAEHSEWLRQTFKFLSVISFTVLGDSGEIRRLAALSYVPPTTKRLSEKTLLRIFKLRDGVSTMEFSLNLPAGSIYWNELGSLPSGQDFPGVVVWGTVEATRDVAKVVAYVNGKFQVVLDEAYNVKFVDVDFDGIPEILSEDIANPGDTLPPRMQLWTWTGAKYVRVGHVRTAQIYSREVIRAVKAAKRTHTEKPAKAGPRAATTTHTRPSHSGGLQESSDAPNHRSP